MWESVCEVNFVSMGMLTSVVLGEYKLWTFGLDGVKGVFNSTTS